MENKKTAEELCELGLKTQRGGSVIEETMIQREERCQKAFEYFKEAASLGHQKAKYHLAWCYLDNYKNKYKDIKKGVQLIVELAKSGLDLAQHNLSAFYLFGNYGFDKDMDKCVEWELKAAKQGNTYSITHLIRYHKKYLEENDLDIKTVKSWGNNARRH